MSRNTGVRAAAIIEFGLLRAAPLGYALAAVRIPYPDWDFPAEAAWLAEVWQQYGGVFGVKFMRGESGQDGFEPAGLLAPRPRTGRFAMPRSSPGISSTCDVEAGWPASGTDPSNRDV